MKSIVTGASGLLGSEIINQDANATGLSSKDCNLCFKFFSLIKFKIRRLK